MEEILIEVKGLKKGYKKEKQKSGFKLLTM